MADDAEVMSALLGKIYGILGEQDPINNVQGRETFVSFTRPGIPITADALDFGYVAASVKEADAAAGFSDLANIVPSNTGYWNPTGRSVVDEYSKCIDQPLVPLISLTDQDKTRLQEAMGVLEQDVTYVDHNTGAVKKAKTESALYERYLAKQTAYLNALDAYNSAFADYILRRGTDPSAEMLWLQREPVLRKRVKSVYDSFVAAGKGQVDSAIATRDGIERRGAERLFGARRDRFNDHKRSAGGFDYLYTKYFPEKFWTAPEAWTTVNFNHNEVHKVDTSKIENYGGSAGAGFMLWSFSASASHSSQRKYSRADTSDLEITFSLAKIPIRRSWLDAGVFRSKNWALNYQIFSRNDNLSDGQKPPKGTMTHYPTALVVARDVRVNISMSSTVNTYAMDEISASGSAGFGPWSIRGNYYKKTEQTTHDFVKDGRGIEVKGMQIIGFVLEELPRCPDPDKTLNWPPGTKFEEISPVPPGA